MSLVELVEDPGAAIAEIGAYLDGLDPDARWTQVAGLDRARQRTLYGKALSEVDLSHFVGEAQPGSEVIHDGVNTLSVPPPLRRFQKRFCQPDAESRRLFGYNEGPTRRILGPGYFVAVPGAEGGVVVDYYQVPDGAVPRGWPPVVPNSKGLQRFVYHETRDVMRRVSTYVSIGAAHRQDKAMDHYFVLCRR
jgi:hypothetical protein